MHKGSRRLQSVAFLLVLALLLSSWYAQIRIENNLRLERAASLQTVLDTTHQALRSWYKEQRASAIVWANNPRVRSLTRQLLNTKRTQAELLKSPAEAELRKLLIPVLQSHKYQGFFVLDMQGISLASSRDNNIGTPSLLQNQPEFLHKLASGQSALSLPLVSDVPLPNGRGQLSSGMPTMFVGAPLYGDKGKLIALFVFRINPLEDFSAILQRGGIGETGESIAFNRDGRLISSSHFEPELRMRGLLKPGVYSMLNVWLRVPMQDKQNQASYTGYPESWPLSLMASAGTKGASGQNMQGFVGYYGKPVISTWLWDDELGFGIATEMGVEEAYRTMHFVQFIVNILSGFAIVLLLAFSIYFMRSQRKLQDSEQQIASIIDLSDEAVISIDSQENIIMVNQAAVRMFGYGADEMLGGKLSILLPEWARNTHSKHIHTFSEANENMIPRDVRNIIQGHRKSGENFPMEATISKQNIGGREIFTVSARDISERLKAEEQLRNRELMFRQVFEASKDAILILKNNRFVDCNDATVRMLRAHNKEEVLSRHPWELSPEFQPDGQRSDIKAEEMIQTAYQRHFHRFEWVHKRMNGEDFPVEVTLTTTQIGGLPHLHVMWNEIATRKQAEEALRHERDRAQSYLDTVEALMVALDKNGRITMLNRKASEVLGYSEEELLGRDWFETCMPQPVGVETVRPIYEKIVSKQIQAGDSFEDPVLTRDGVIRTIAWHTTLLNDANGNIIGILSAGQDITDLKMAEEKEEQLQRQLMHTQKMEALGRLTGGIAHDFNNILASAKGYTELAMMQAEEVHDEKQLHYLTEVYKSTDRAAAVVKQLLAFARGSKAEPTHQLLQDVVEEALVMMRPLLTARIGIVTCLDPGIAPVLIDNVQFNQVLLNLCINARDAMDGEGRIEIGVRKVKGEGECSSCLSAFEIDGVELYVSDNGPGIEADSLSRIFDPFFTSKEVGKGSGMGLSVVHGIIHDHHGHIQVESEPGKGTTFHIYLPYAD